MRRRQYLSSVAGISAVSALGVQSVGAEVSQLSSLAAQTDGTMTINDPEGDDIGPGSYTYPANLEKGQFDVTQLDVEETDTHWEFTAHMGVQNNGFDNDAGFSTQVIQLYIRDPNAPDDAPTSSESRLGAVSTFQNEYHYRVHVQAGNTLLEHAGQDPEGEDYEPLVSGFPASGDTENNTISFSVPKEPFDTANFAEMSGAIMMFSQDGFGVGGIRQGFVSGEAADWKFGGAKEGALESAPRVIDLVGPETVINQEEALAYSEGSPPSIPLYSMADLVAGGTINDPEGDDNGPGTYTYPANLEKGQFDVTGVDLNTTPDHWEFTAHMGVQKNQFGLDAGFSSQVIQLYIRDPNAPDDAPTSAESRLGAVSTFQEEYHYRAHVQAGNTLIEHAGQDPEGEDYEPLVSGFPASGDTENSTISFSLPRDTFDSDRLGDLKITMLVFSQDGFGTGGIRQGFVTGEASDWNFGGAKEGAIESAPRALDLVGPDNVVEQEESLSYSAGSPPSIPLFNVTSLVTGEAAVGISAVAAPIGDVWATLDGTLNGTNSEADGDVDLTYQWEQTGGPEAEIADTSAAETTFTAPEVQEETTLEFTLTVTDPDGNEATDTTTATIKPQSANDAPIADAGEDQTASPGDAVSLQTVNSEDPNGGTLSFQWTQTGGTPEVDLLGADSSGAAFTAPDVDEETTLTFELAVSDGQGKTTTDTVSVTISPSDGGGTETETESGDGFGPGFGAVTGLVGAAGGAAYAAKSRLGSNEDEE
ncbi:glucodextranase DOMON-like domain-containing protein [Halapricum desulfuricans]|uniref:DOMON-like domain of various glycoside hydrolases n=1 Tax=Halapricum desulfuricans TaxID=2841257 RepID=A0A897NRR3_9EURY|nr:glucodextranase DOMON-like domain-containing protein [Halapricum desulfuricans]QSG15104.1 DOMON-like domain of various glycoside hydrolases [Halapricum desulfuricans]